MSYTVFALKWRPKNFQEVVGQNHITGILKNSLQKNRLAHAYLFAGPRGVGKTSTARILAKALNCKNGPTINPCGACPACLEIAQGRSLDVIEIDGASNRGIDEIRTLRENVKFSPTGGKFKIYIIDEVHMLTTEAFNALLKTLEEPPEFVKFIFATTQPHKVIPTILSRCQRFDFRRIPNIEIIAQLEKIMHDEKLKADKEVLATIAKASDGSLRDAESILDQLVSFSQESVSLNDVISVLGVVNQDVLFAITETIIRKDAQEALRLLNQVIESGKDTGMFLSDLIGHFRNLMIAKVTKGDAKLIDLPQEICVKLLEQTQLMSLEEIFSSFNILVNTQDMAKRLESVRIPLEISLVRLAHNKKEVNSAPAPVKSTPEIKSETPKQEPAPEPAQTKAAAAVPLDDVKKSWQNIIDSLGRSKMSLATYLNEGRPMKVEKNTLIIGFPKDYSLHKESLERKDAKALIEKTISEALQADLRVNFILSEEIVKEHHEDSPLLKSALETFNGRLIK